MANGSTMLWYGMVWYGMDLAYALSAPTYPCSHPHPQHPTSSLHSLPRADDPLLTTPLSLSYSNL